MPKSICQQSLRLEFGLVVEDLYCREGLARLDEAFLDYLRAADAGLAERLIRAREDPASVHGKAESDLIIEIAPYLEDFVGSLFGISADLRALQARHHQLAPLYSIKRRFVQKKAISGVTAAQAEAIDGDALACELEMLVGEPLTERAFVDHFSRWLESETEHASALPVSARYAAWAALSPAGQ